MDNFAHLGMEGADESNKPRRMVAIISFENTANLRLDYIDVANASNLTRAKNVIENLSVASGTNIEGALQLARNVINNGMSNASEIKDVDYLYTILLTDGEPSMGMTNRSDRSSTTSITGDWNGSYSPNYADVDEVSAIAAAIRGFTMQSRLYSICLGVEIDHDSNDQDVNSTMAMKPFSTWSDLGITSNTTVGDWLRSFSHAVYGDEETASADTILANFENVMAQIQIAARAWEVRDTMGEHMDFVDHVQVRSGNTTVFNVVSESGDVVTWNLLQSDYNPQISEFTTNADGSITGNLGYTYRYIVELDNFHTGYNHGETQANASAVLDYAVENEQDGTFALYTNKEFTVPKVEGYTGELTFKKIDDNGDPVSGMTFTIKSDDAPTGWQLTAKSAADGTVTFSGIPSGHEFRLDEQTTEGYKPIGDLPFTVEWAQTKIPANSELKNVNGVYTLVNEIIPTDSNWIDLKVTKAFVDEQNNSLPAAALTDISKAYARFSLDYPNNTTERIELYNGQLVKEIEGLDVGVHKITEVAAPVEGYELIGTRVTFSDSLDANAEHVISADGKTVSFTAERSAQQNREYTVAYTNVYRQKTGSVTLNKVFRAHTLGGANSETGTTLLSSGYDSVTATIALFSANNLNTPIQTKTMSGSDWSWDIGKLPAGDYVLMETNLSGSIANHAFLHARFTGIRENGTDSAIDADAQHGGLRFTVKDGGVYALTLENHYIPHSAQLRVHKHFHGDVNGAEAFVEIYRQLYNDPNADPQIIAHLYAGAYQSLSDIPSGAAPVASLTLSEANNWTAITSSLPYGQYTIVENGAGVSLPGYALSVNHPILVTIDASTHGSVIVSDLGNTYTKKTGSLTVAKTFEPEDAKAYFESQNASINVYLVRKGETAPYQTLQMNGGNNWKVTFSDVPFADYELFEEIDAGDTNSAYWDANHVLSASWSPSYNITLNEWENAQNAALTRNVVNKYEAHAHDVTIKKAYTLDGNALNMGSAQVGTGYTVNVTLTPLKSDYTIDDTLEVRSFQLSNSNAYEHTMHLPVGMYLITETFSGMNPAHLFENAVFSLSDEDHTSLTVYPLDSTKTMLTIGVADDTAHPAITLTATNNHKTNPASITVNKYIAGQLTNEQFVSKDFYIELYKDGLLQDTLVGTLALDQDNDFTGVFENLDPTAEYYLVERHDSGSTEYNPSIPDYSNTAVWLYDRENISVDNPFRTESFSIEPGQNAVFTVVNTYTRKIGEGVTVVKDYVFADNADIDVSGEQVSVTIEPVNAQVGQQAAYSLTLVGETVSTLSLPVGQYKVTELVSSAEDIENYTLTDVTVIVAAGSSQPVQGENGMTFTVGETGEVAITVRNTYARNQVQLTVSKTIAGDLPETDVKEVALTISGASGAAVGDPVVLSEGNGWSATVSLPTGSYTIAEAVTLKDGAKYPLDVYTNTVSWTKVSAGSSVMKTNEDGSASITLVNGDTEALELKLTNAYMLNPVDVRFVKEFEGFLPEEMPDSVVFVLTDVTDANKVYTVELPGDDGAWSRTVSLPEGTYTVVEQLRDDQEGKRIISSFPGLTNNQLTVVPGQKDVVVTCINRLDRTLFVKIPLRKTINKVSGIAPDMPVQLRFQFDMQVPEGVSVNFAALSGGTFVRYDRAAGTVDVRMTDASSFSGYVEFSGFGDALRGVRGTITESVYPYQSVADAAAAGWTYDRSSYAFSLAGTTDSAASLTMTKAGKPAAEAAFTNTFKHPGLENIPKLPQTGDKSSMLLWMTLIVLSGAVLLVLRRREDSEA